MISKNNVKYISHLARINLEENELEALTTDLEEILNYIEKLKKLDVSGIEPTSHVLPLQNVFREDKRKPSLNQGAVLKMGSAQAKGFFQVPQVIE